jgi:hypothetical protein
MTDGWNETKKETGICVSCGKCRDDCIVSSLGWICHDCWQDFARNSKLGGPRIAIMPSLDKAGYAVMEGAVYITVGGVLYFFRHREHAEDLLRRIQKSEPGISAQVRFTMAILPFLYVLSKPELKMLCVEDLKDSGG